MTISGGSHGKLTGKAWFILLITEIWGLILGVDAESPDEAFFAKIWGFVKSHDDLGKLEGLSLNPEELVLCAFFVMLSVYGFKFWSCRMRTINRGLVSFPWLHIRGHIFSFSKELTHRILAITNYVTFSHLTYKQFLSVVDDPYWCSVKIDGQKRYTKEVTGENQWSANVSLLVYNLHADKVNIYRYSTNRLKIMTDYELTSHVHLNELCINCWRKKNLIARERYINKFSRYCPLLDLSWFKCDYDIWSLNLCCVCLSILQVS